MVRINLINPKYLSDQHLVAEYDEMLMLVSYVQRYPKIKFIKGVSEIPKNYTLNKGHMKFFKDKLLYLKNRHELLKDEMRKRKFETNKTINLKFYPKELCNDWKPNSKDYCVILERITWKLNLKPEYYRYYGKYEHADFFIKLLKDAKSNSFK